MPRSPRVNLARRGIAALTLAAALGVAGLAGAAPPAPAPAPASAPAPTRWAAAIEHDRQLLAALRAKEGIPGLSVAVGLRGEILWAEGFGEAGSEPGRPVRPETRFRLGSVSKLFTADAAARLVQDGKLDIDKPIQTYVPTFPDKGAPITVRQLAGHLAGIRHYQSKDFVPFSIDDQHFPTVTASLGVFANDPLVSPPGESYNYSTFGYTLIAAAIEGASGKDFLTYLQESVITPLGLASTGPDLPGVDDPARTAFFNRNDDGKVVPSRPIDPSYKWAGGGLLSTPSDLVRFGSAHLGPGLFSPATLALLFTPQHTHGKETRDGKETGVGFGWRVGKDPENGLAIVHHAGNIDGGQSMLLVYRDSGLVVALLSNLRGVPEDAEAVAFSLAKPFLAELGVTPAPPAAPPAQP